MNATAVRTAFAAALAAGLVLVAGPALASNLAEPKTTTAGGMTVMAFDDTETSSHFIPKGGEPTDQFPAGQPAIGDAFSFTDDLKQNGTLVATDAGKCTVTSENTSDCDVTVTFAGGTVRVAGPSTFTAAGVPSTIPLTSGTGAYQGIKGTATVLDLTDDQDPSDKLSTVTVKFVLPGTQVEEVPAGGAAAGGGFGGDGAPIALLALAGAAIVTGTGIVGVGRRVRRR